MESPTFFHKSVMVDEVVDLLKVQPHGTYVDATFGSGGHTRAILQKNSTCTVIGIDWDQDSLKRYAPLITEEFGNRFIPLFGSFAHIWRLFKKASIKQVDGILADFGTSQMQITERPGFSIYRDTPLDMRMSPAHQRITAAHIVNQASAEELAHIFFTYGEERYSRKIAQAIAHDRKQQRFTTTRQLAELIQRIVPRSKKSSIHPATRVFQALRIQVNNELDNIDSFLKQSLELLANEGRLVCISFHSLEDRLVKQFFKDKEHEGRLEIITKKPLVAAAKERAENPSSRSAKVRAAARIRD